MANVILDSNIVIAYIENQNENHEAAKAAVDTIRDAICISALTLTECLIFTFRESYEFAMESLLTIDGLIDFVFEVSRDIAILAARIGAESGLNLADAVILATADFHKIALWTFDRRLSNKSRNAKYLLSV